MLLQFMLSYTCGPISLLGRILDFIRMKTDERYLNSWTRLQFLYIFSNEILEMYNTISQNLLNPNSSTTTVKLRSFDTWILYSWELIICYLYIRARKCLLCHQVIIVFHCLLDLFLNTLDLCLLPDINKIILISPLCP